MLHAFISDRGRALWYMKKANNDTLMVYVFGFVRIRSLSMYLLGVMR